MKDKNLHIIQKIGANVCRFLLAASFIFSGFVKAVDPLGFQYKIQDYLAAFGMTSWFPSFFPLLGGILLSAAEFSIGIFLFFGIKRTLSTTLALMLMIFMTPLTLYLAIFDPVSDCGCFGDAWVLTNWETFAKNIVLLIAAIAVFQWRKMLVRFVTLKMEWLISLYTIFFVFTLSFYCLDRLPEDGEEVTLENGIHLKVQGIDQNRIIKVLMTIPEPNEEHVEHSSETSENHE